MRYSPELNFPLQIFVTDQHAFELWEVYQMIFEQRYGRIEGMNHSGARGGFSRTDKKGEKEQYNIRKQ